MALTPLKVDLTDHDNLRYWAQSVSRLSAAQQPATP